MALMPKQGFNLQRILTLFLYHQITQMVALSISDGRIGIQS